jgi:hypothetical protein
MTAHRAPTRRVGQFAAPAAPAVLVVVCAILWPSPAAAYRPFDGTDAAVADLGEVEIEFQPTGIMRTPSTTVPTGPYAIFNYGFAERWELVLQAEGRPPPIDSGPISVPNAALLKYVVQPGVLQDKPGPSMAIEFGALLPDIGGSGAGFSFNNIISQRWDWGTVHFNLEGNLTPDQRGEFFVDAIVEGPHKWTVRPVVEMYSDTVFGQQQTFSALVGAIWQVRDNLAFDAAVRTALVDGRPVHEIRAGLTIGFPINLGKPMTTPAAGVIPLVRR